jgi:hypothetical protein
MRKKMSGAELEPGHILPGYNYLLLKKLSNDGLWKVLSGVGVYRYDPNDPYYKSPKLDVRVPACENTRPSTCYLSVGSQYEIETDAFLPDALEKFRPALPTDSKSVYMGTDPEMFLADRRTGRCTPAFNVLPRKKDRGYNVLFADGFQAEANVGAAQCLEVLSKGIAVAISSMSSIGRIRPESTIRFARKTFQKIAREDLEFGCEPSLNVYGMQGTKVVDPAEVPYRFAGGHIHIGWGSSLLYKSAIQEIVMALDKVLGVISVSLAEGLDTEVRRHFYGLAGEYRTPAHGLEYRVLSNFWLQHPLVYHLCFHLARYTALLTAIGELKWIAEPGQVIECINSNNVGMARHIIGENRDFLREMLGSIFYGDQVIANALFMIEHGASCCLSAWPTDIASSWSDVHGGDWYWRYTRDRDLSKTPINVRAYEG